MSRRSFSDAAQLTNKLGGRPTAAYAYLAVLGSLTAGLVVWFQSSFPQRPDNLVVVVYLVVALVSLSAVDVRIERGRLTLSGIVIGTAAILLNPIDAAVVGLALGIPMVRRGRWPIVANAVMAGAYTGLAGIVATAFRIDGQMSLAGRLVVLAAVNALSWLLVAVGLSLRSGESIRSIVVHNFTASFYVAFGYFVLASLLTSYVLDGSALGFLLASIVFLLALALTDTIAGRRVRRVLESELSDADRHLFHSRAVEGVVHNLRNHMATAVGYLKEIDLKNLNPVDRDAVETATAAANDAVTVLRTLSQGATPRVSYAKEPIDLNELVNRAIGMARPRAHTKTIELAVRETSDAVNVRADPLLLREVLTNLINNAIDAAPENGHVVLSTGRRNNGWTYLSVADDGPGVTDDNRHHLFEPHFTTKETGTGLGLFMSYGIVREHQGSLSYEGSRRGAVFTVTLPPYGR